VEGGEHSYGVYHKRNQSMTDYAKSDFREVNPSLLNGEKSNETKIILEELKKILDSRYFKRAARCRQFLQYIVEQTLNGDTEQLKERTIGSTLFGRPLSYATGDDPVVRVQASEVRRRLEQYYQSAHNASKLRIELPLYSYTAQFSWTPEEIAPTVPAASPKSLSPSDNRRRRQIWWLLVACAVLVLVAAVFFAHRWRATRQQSKIEQFWAPVFATKQPVLICLAKRITYKPSAELYERYSRTHGGAFLTNLEQLSQPFPMGPKERIAWGDMTPITDYGVAVGDVHSAVNFAMLLGELGKPGQVRIGTGYSFEDLRNSPQVLIGAFNNKWALELTSGLRFVFVEKSNLSEIREQVPNGRVWHTVPPQHTQGTGEDSALIVRLLNSQTGQFTIIVGGIESWGTQAASELVTTPEYLEQGLRGAPANWQKKNMELVVQTTITDSIAGPPRVVAAYYW
jgi:hypothetical protein